MQNKVCKTGNVQTNIVISDETDNFDLELRAKPLPLGEIVCLLKSMDKDLEVVQTLEYLLKRDIKLDVKNSYAEIDDNVHTTDVSIDLDSVIAKYEGIHGDVLQEIDRRLKFTKTKEVFCGIDVTFPDGLRNELGLSIKENLQQCVDPVALAIVSLARDKEWIRRDDLKQLINIDDAKYMPLSVPGVPRPTVGFRFHPRHQENNNMFNLPTPANSDPVHGWIRLNPKTVGETNRIKYINQYMRCVRDIAAALCYVYTPANHYELIQIFSDKLVLSNDGKCLGGMWIHRLAYIKMLFELGVISTNAKDSTIIEYMEETFHGKARCSTVQLKINLCTLEDANYDMVSKQAAEKLSYRICEGMATDHSILRLHEMNILNGKIILGIGLQYEIVSEREHGVTYEMYYPCQFSNADDEDKSDWVRKEYIAGGLCRGLSGFVETSVFIDYALTEDNGMLPAQHGPSSKVENYFNVKDGSDECKCLLLRKQVYYNWLRYSFKEALVSYETKLSTRLQYCRHLRQGRFFSAVDDDIEGDINIADLYRNITEYSKAKTQNLSSAASKPGFRQEMAFMVSNLKSSHSTMRRNINISLWNMSEEERHDYVRHNISKILTEPVLQSFLDANKKTKIVKLSLVVSYMLLMINAYILLYNMCLLVLNQKTLQPLDRNSVCIFMKFIQDFLSIFYSGSDKPASYVHKMVLKKGDSKSVTIKYSYAVFRKALGNKLGRPYSLLPTLPTILKEYMVENMFGEPETRSAALKVCENRGFILSQPMNTEESVNRKMKYARLVEEGHESCMGIVFQCANTQCLNRYHLSMKSLFLHLDLIPACNSCAKRGTSNDISGDGSSYTNATNDNDYPTTSLTRDVVAHIHAAMERECKNASRDHEFALSEIREGRSVYLSGDGGAGKSYLGRILLKQCLLIHGDWVLKPYGRDRVFGVAFQGIACTNMGTSFTSIHRYLEIGDFEQLNPSLNDDEIKQYCQRRFEGLPALRKKMRNTEVLLIDEVGNINDVLGRYLMAHLKVAKDTTAAFGGVQLIAMGQVTQMLPVDEKKMKNQKNKQLSWGTNQELNVNTRHINLKTLYRSTGDEKLQGLIKAARHGNLTQENISYLKLNCGKNVKNIMGDASASITDKNQITELFYELNNVQTSNEKFIISHSKHLQYYNNLQKVFAKDYISAPYGSGANEDKDKNADAILYDAFSSIRGRHGSFDRAVRVAAEMFVYVGMPVVLTQNIWSQDLTAVYNLSKGTQGKIKHIKKNNDTGEVTEIVLSLTLTSECGHPFQVMHTSKRHLGFLKMIPEHESAYVYKRDMKAYKEIELQTGRPIYVQRSMFGFTYGKNLSWSSIQGLTMKMISLDLNINNFVTSKDSIYQVPALFYVALSRVRSLDDLNIIWPTNSKENYFSFFNRVHHPSVDFEKDWVLEADKESAEYILKAQDNIALMEMQRKNYFKSPNPSACNSYSVLLPTELDLQRDNNMQECLKELWKFLMLSVHFEFDEGFFLPICDTKAQCMYNLSFQKKVQATQKCETNTMIFSLLKTYMMESLCFAFRVKTEVELKFTWMQKEDYHSWGKTFLARLKGYMYQMLPDLGESIDKSAQKFRHKIIKIEYNKLKEAEKTQMEHDIQQWNTDAYALQSGSWDNNISDEDLINSADDAVFQADLQKKLQDLVEAWRETTEDRKRGNLKRTLCVNLNADAEHKKRKV